MTHEERATWIRRVFILVLAAGVLGGVWFYQEKNAPPPAPPAEERKHLLEVIHYHKPGDAASEQLAEILGQVQEKYGWVILVRREDVMNAIGQVGKEGLVKAPKVVMMAGEVRAFEFQGAWPRAAIERKIDEILHGLKRVGKDWRPEVKGMQPAGAAPAS